MKKIKEPLRKATLILQNNEILEGFLFGYPSSVSGEIVFNTGMVGYPETLSDPSYFGQLLVLTHPLIGNYGIPSDETIEGISLNFESEKIQARGLIVSDYSENYHHWNSTRSLHDWLLQNKVPGLFGIDTRRLTKILREDGSMLAKIIIDDDIEYFNPDDKDLISEVCPKTISKYGSGSKKILLVDCGCKNNIIRSLLERDVTLTRVPANHDFLGEEFDGIVISNGPGNPAIYGSVVEKVKEAIKLNKPILGICLGHQIISLAAGAKTYKLKYGHRSQNQPVQDMNSGRCFITSQNHGFAVEEESLKEDWEPWFKNLNDNTNEGIKHKNLPIMSVQFHPEANPGPVDTSFIFDLFLNHIK